MVHFRLFRFQRITAGALVLLIGPVAVALGQAGNPWTRYDQAPYFQNAAFSGMAGNTELKLGYRQQWTSFEGAPREYFLGVDHAFGDAPGSDSVAAQPSLTTGASGHLAGSNYGLVQSFRGGAAYAVHLPLVQRYSLSFGMAAAYSRSKADVPGLIARDTQDPIYQNLVQAGGALTYFDLDAGMLFHGSDIYAGYALRLIHAQLGDNPGQGGAPSVVRHTIQAGYRRRIGPEWELMPSALLRIESGLDNLYSLSVKACYRSMITGGVAFRPQTAVSLFAGYQFTNSLTMSYAYDINTGSLGTVSAGSHEVIIGFRPFSRRAAPPAVW